MIPCRSVKVYGQPAPKAGAFSTLLFRMRSLEHLSWEPTCPTSPVRACMHAARDQRRALLPPARREGASKQCGSCSARMLGRCLPISLQGFRLQNPDIHQRSAALSPAALKEMQVRGGAAPNKSS